MIKICFKRFVKNKDFTNKDINLERFRSLQSNMSSIVETTKPQYFSKIANKLSGPSISSKIYWSV